MHDWATSPFMVPVATFAFVLGIIIVKAITEHQARRLRSEERMAAIARGLPLPPEPEPDHLSSPDARLRVARGIRTGGIVCVTVGIGMALFSFALTWILHQHEVLAVAAAGLIPFAIGVGLLVDYQLRAKAFSERP